MKLTVVTPDERLCTIDVDPDELVENVKAILEVETGIPLHQQQLLHHGRELDNRQCLNAAGVGDNDLLTVAAAAAAAPVASSSSGGHDLDLNPDGSAVNPVNFIRRLKSDAQTMRAISEKNPEFSSILHSNNVEALQNVLRQQHRQRADALQRQNAEIALMNADPFDLDAQRKIEEAIRQKNIDENWEAALEHNPEAFASVSMLYVDMEVNGHELKAFVDSGAQITIISRACAERCGLLRLMDKRYVGIARGVGQTAIVGRIHVAPLKIGSNFYPCSFTVLDQPNPDFIFGLDMLRKHQCCIDLNDNVLRVGGGAIAVPFLHEKDIPRHDLLQENQPASASSALPSQPPTLATASPQSAEVKWYRSVGVMKKIQLINGKLDLETMEAECGFVPGSLQVISRPIFSTAAFQPAAFNREGWGLSELTFLELERRYEFEIDGIFRVTGEPNLLLLRKFPFGSRVRIDIGYDGKISKSSLDRLGWKNAKLCTYGNSSDDVVLDGDGPILGERTYFLIRCDDWYMEALKIILATGSYFTAIVNMTDPSKRLQTVEVLATLSGAWATFQIVEGGAVIFYLSRWLWWLFKWVWGLIKLVLGLGNL